MNDGFTDPSEEQIKLGTAIADAIRSAVANERERCAKLAERYPLVGPQIAAAIRKGEA